MHLLPHKISIIVYTGRKINQQPLFCLTGSQNKKCCTARQRVCVCVRMDVRVGKGAGYFLADLWYSSSATTSSTDSYI